MRTYAPPELSEPAITRMRFGNIAKPCKLVQSRVRFVHRLCAWMVSLMFSH